MGKIGSTIFNAFKKSCPLSLNGTPKLPANMKFDLKNPYILEALPEEKSLDYFVKFDGQDLNQVCNKLDDEIKGFDNGELNALYKKVFHSGKKPSIDTNTDAMVYLSSLPADIGMKYDAHGLAKESVFSQLKQLNELLTNGIDKTRSFCTAPLSVSDDVARGAGAGLGTGGGCAYRDGSFIIAGEKSKMLAESGIKHVIVNDAYYNIIPDLQRKFPNVNFVRADRAVEYFSGI